MLKKTTAFVGGALVLSSVVFTTVSADRNSARSALSSQDDSSVSLYSRTTREEKRGAQKETVSHGIVTGLTDDGFFMEARTRNGRMTVMVHGSLDTVYLKDKKAAFASDVELGARVRVHGQKDPVGTSQWATRVQVISKSFGTYPFPEDVKRWRD